MATQKSTTPKPALKLRMRVNIGEQIAVGPGKIQLLEALAEQGSITAAAKSLDMSYRRAWLLIDELNRSLAEPAVASATGGQRGGGSELTEAGRRLIELYRGIEAQALKACAPDIRKLLKLLASP
ncbi:LysR family transcriptional regulator [Paucibacter sp. R3-3]|uniref:LysR family transcriptional regulator n=1 Tax=Roseateles agri TaxID=3098619 RepID=A0ABU5DEB1_9BURK|nr:LysR family transcriptional regulator [Paucibacter sp. R3-3]MDY0744621.1 LysR family transcriptional regulator [Paucibacter sp. R3-3]